MNNEEKLRNISKNIEFLYFDKPVTSCKTSADEGFDIKEVVKTVLFKDKQENIYAVIIRGPYKVDTNKIRIRFNCSKLRLLNHEEVMQFTGYPAGGVPPFGFSAIFILDDDLKEDEIVVAGGGTINSLMRLKVSEIKRLTSPEVLDVKGGMINI